MLHQQHGDATLFAQLAHQLHHVHGLVVVHAGKGLVQQQHRGLRSQANGHAQRPQMALRQIRSQLIADRVQAQEVDDVIGRLGEQGLIGGGQFGA